MEAVAELTDRHCTACGTSPICAPALGLSVHAGDNGIRPVAPPRKWTKFENGSWWHPFIIAPSWSPALFLLKT